MDRSNRITRRKKINMAYNPTTATPAEKWAFREQLLKDYLDEIPHTTNQRRMIDHHIAELGALFADCARSNTVILDHSNLHGL